MLKEPRLRELSRDDVYAEYFSRLADQENRKVDEVFYEKMKEVNEIFRGKTKLEVMIKGTVEFDRNFQKLFTFLNKTYDLTAPDSTQKILDGLEQCLRDLDFFKAFMNGEPINYFSEIENEYVNYTRVLNAKVFMELT